jgi:predicted RNase H-like nuclease (RuvC/YqgF family)
MRKIIFAVMLASTAVAAAPASAQGWRPQPAVQRQIQQDINQLDNRIQRAQQRRTISQREATGLRREALNLQRRYNQFARNGLTRPEVAQLEGAVNRLHQRLRLERRDWDGRRG